MINRLGKFFLLCGGAAFVATVAWWYVFFAQLLDENVKQASGCFYKTTADCAAENLVISLMGNIPVYDPVALWITAGFLLFGVVMMGASSSKGAFN